ncbi:MAG: nitroreductase family protein [Lachnospiraceae bacterium]|jgi:nitroreductase|nr:nitroreductase family protein [Lachnospiraceae bacterium]
METLKTIAKRHSTRAFSDKPVPKEALETILAAGSAAPVGGKDYESLHLTVITDKAALDRIVASFQAATKLDRNPLYGTGTFVLVSSKEPKAPGLNYANAACVIDHMLIAAADLGVDSVYLWGVLNALNADAKLLKALGIPEGFTPASGVALGYAAEPSDAEKDLTFRLATNYV